MENSTKQSPWYEAYPPPTTQNPPSITCQMLLDWFIEGKRAGNDFVLVDLRKNDHEGGSIRDSINIPAQSMYQSIPMLYTLFSNAGIKDVIWYCGSSKGRGTRAAAWFMDYLESQNDNSMKSLILLGGIKAWACAGPEYSALMDEYCEKTWQDQA